MENNPTLIWVVALALADAKGRWLMQRRPDRKHHGGLWEFPGGKIEPGETPAAALCREIGEELGIALDPQALEPVTFAESAAGSGGPKLVILLYTCPRWAGDPAPLEGGAIGWFTPEEIVALEKPELDYELAERLFADGRGYTRRAKLKSSPRT